MDQYIAHKLHGSAADSTVIQRVSILKKLAKEFPKAKDFSFLNDTEKVTEWLNTYEKVTTRTSNLFIILAAIRLDPSVVSQQAKDYYDTLRSKLVVLKADARQNNIKSPKQVKTLNMTLTARQAQIQQIIKQFSDQYEMEVTGKLTKTMYNRIADKQQFIKQLQDIVICACYLLQPALRNDWAGLQLTGKVKGLPTDKNFLYMRAGKLVLVLNLYKNAGSMGHQKIEINHNQLKGLLTFWITLIKLHSKELNLAPIEHPFYYFVSKNKFYHNANEDTMRRSIPEITKRVLGQTFTINDFRHLWEISIQQDPAYATMTLAQKNELHRQLLHSPGAALEYNVI